MTPLTYMRPFASVWPFYTYLLTLYMVHFSTIWRPFTPVSPQLGSSGWSMPGVVYALMSCQRTDCKQTGLSAIHLVTVNTLVIVIVGYCQHPRHCHCWLLSTPSSLSLLLTSAA